MEKEVQFQNPSFSKRLRGMLGVDFYRLFHTPMLYIFLMIAAFIPGIMLMTMGTGEDASNQLFYNAWNIVAANHPIYVINDIGEYANMNMVFIFGGIMVSIFIGHDYKSGYVKQLFTTHAKKQDYMMSKTISCAFAMICMCMSYLAATIGAGLMSGHDFSVNIGSLIIALLGKMVMSFGWASLYTFLNVIFRRYFGVSIASSFFFGTGILIIGVAAIVENIGLPTSFLNLFLYGSSVNACLSSNIGSLIICIFISALWSVIYNVAGSAILYKSDVY